MGTEPRHLTPFSPSYFQHRTPYREFDTVRFKRHLTPFSPSYFQHRTPYREFREQRLDHGKRRFCNDFTAFLSNAVEAAKLAGEIISKNFQLRTEVVEHKGQFIGEETSAVYGTADLTDAPTWVIDPLDGTTNFVHRFPFVCVSIALTIGKIPTVGVVYNPILDELYTAIQGRGSFLNDSRISSSSQSEMIKALLATGFGTKRDKLTVDANTDRIKELLFKVRSVRMIGSCALNLCGVASGSLDLFYSLGYGGLWDVAAGVLIVQEAGGCVFDPTGDDFNITSQRVAATNAHLKKALVDALRGKV